MGYWGGLKTSPWTSFHPDSSMVSSYSKGPESEAAALALEKLAPAGTTQGHTLTRAQCPLGVNQLLSDTKCQVTQ